MLKLTKTGIGLLTKQYRSVLRKCLLLNLGLFFPILTSVYGDTIWLNRWQYHPFDYPDAMMLDYGDGNVYAYRSGQAYGRVYLKSGTDISTLQYLTKNGNYTDSYLSRCSDADSSTYGESYCFKGIGNEFVTVQSNIAKLDYALYNYYYTKTEADARYIGTEAGARTQVIHSKNKGEAISFVTDLNSGSIVLHNTEHNLSATYDFIRLSASSDNVGGYLELKNRTNNTTKLTPTYFTLNGSAISATGIVANAIQNSTALITSGGVYDALNYYYTFRDDKISEADEFALFLNNEKLSNVFEA